MSAAGDTLPRVDLLFPLMGATVPRDHAYPLYAAIARLLDGADCTHAIGAVVHGSKDVGIFPIRGTPDPGAQGSAPARTSESAPSGTTRGTSGGGTLHLTDRSALRLRVSTAKLPALLPLAGKSLDIAGHRVRVGVPTVRALVPAATLASPLVLIKLARPPGRHDQPPAVTPDRFLDAARKQLADLGITAAEPSIPLIRAGPRAGQPRRRVLRVKDQTHAGFALLVEGLTAEESIILQEHGLGGRRLMGCGLFLPVREGAS